MLAYFHSIRTYLILFFINNNITNSIFLIYNYLNSHDKNAALFKFTVLIIILIIIIN